MRSLLLDRPRPLAHRVSAPKAKREIKIDPEFQALIPPHTDEEAAQLEANIERDGCRDPLVVWAETDLLLDGHKRLEICERREFTYKVKTISLADREEAVEWIIKNQFGRRNLTTYQRCELALKYETKIAARAKENQRASGGAVPSRAAEPVDTRQELARIAGVSHDSISKTKEILEKADDATKAALRRGDVSIASVHKEIRGRERTLAKAQRAAALRAEPVPPPEGPFRVISMDPPWRYETRDEDESHRGRTEYPTMTVEEMRGLPVTELAHDDCVLWLWTTNAFMGEAYALLAEWGFTAKTILTWDKGEIGLGNWLRNQTEHCILAVRGAPTVTLTNQSTIIRERAREHSQKPEAFYQLVESLCPGSKLEMFAREARAGWRGWGDEAGAEASAESPAPEEPEPEKASAKFREIEQHGLDELAALSDDVVHKRTKDGLACAGSPKLNRTSTRKWAEVTCLGCRANAPAKVQAATWYAAPRGKGGARDEEETRSRKTEHHPARRSPKHAAKARASAALAPKKGARKKSRPSEVSEAKKLGLDVHKRAYSVKSGAYTNSGAVCDPARVEDAGNPMTSIWKEVTCKACRAKAPKKAGGSGFNYRALEKREAKKREQRGEIHKRGHEAQAMCNYRITDRAKLARGWSAVTCSTCLLWKPEPRKSPRSSGRSRRGVR